MYSPLPALTWPIARITAPTATTRASHGKCERAATASACSYSASKAGLLNFARSIANDYGRHHIRANNILPSLVETELSRSRLQPGESWEEMMAAQFLHLYPLGRTGQPSDVANAALFLASDEASWIIGEDLAVYGGFLARL